MFCRNSKLTHLLQDSLGKIFLGVLLYNSELYNCISEFWHGNLLAIPKTHLVEIAGGDSKTLMFVQISPYEGDVGETLCSLNFASRVRGIELGPARKQLDTGELFKYKQLVCLFDLLSKDIPWFLHTESTLYSIPAWHAGRESKARWSVKRGSCKEA
jgi:hypothetical protein